MDHGVLVDIDVRVGSEMLTKLSEVGVEFDVALWATFEDYVDPRFVLAATWLDLESPLANARLFFDQLSKTDFPIRRQPPLAIRRMSDPFIVEIRQRYANVADIEGERLGGQSFGGRFLEDGYIYRVQ